MELDSQLELGVAAANLPVGLEVVPWLDGLEHMRPLAEKIVTQGDRVMVVLRSPEHVDRALEVIRAGKAKLVSVTPHKSSLEELFIREVKEGQKPLESQS